MPQFEGVRQWSRHAERLLRYNHLTMTLPAGPSAPTSSHKLVRMRKKSSSQPGSYSADSTTTLQYTFDSSANFPRPFLSPSPRFDFSFNPAHRLLPCVLVLHGSDPGGFDVARWMAAGLSHAQHINNPLMPPNSFGSYFAYNLQQSAPADSPGRRGGHRHYVRCHADGEGSDRREPPPDPGARPEEVPGVKKYAVPTPPLGLLSISRPGYLSSTMTWENTFQDEAQSIIRLLGNLGIHSVGIVAHGVAAPVALELASLPLFRDRVKSLAMIDPVIMPTRIQIQAMRTQSALWPEWLRTWVAYKTYARNVHDKAFLQGISELAGPAAASEILDDPFLAELYSGVGVFFTSYNARRTGIRADVEKLHQLVHDSDKRRRWSTVSAPILCITTSRTRSEAERGEFSKDTLIREELNKASLMLTQSKVKLFPRIAGGGELLFPLGAVSHLCLEFLRDHSQFEFRPLPL